uniref:Uncharacterized protein n=1 Tax=Candidatus Kentrum sp. LFY TaxID=2126342 RepID=A0A450UKL8_9GAMM|nr:MAG: hypothetical protein BECKLFY1418A_GA0070994_102825 [Candidatus Kentron sp. LFY]
MNQKNDQELENIKNRYSSNLFGSGFSGLGAASSEWVTFPAYRYRFIFMCNFSRFYRFRSVLGRKGVYRERNNGKELHMEHPAALHRRVQGTVFFLDGVFGLGLFINGGVCCLDIGLELFLQILGRSSALTGGFGKRSGWASRPAMTSWSRDTILLSDSLNREK